jgi:hypothetical protein
MPREKKLIEAAVEACDYMREALHHAMAQLTGPEWDQEGAERFFPLAYEAAKGVALGLEKLDLVFGLLGELRRLYGVERLERSEGR